MPAEVCTIVGENTATGVRTEPCGREATHTAVGLCDQGHSRKRTLCPNHAHIFELFPHNVFCDVCDNEGEGVETSVTYTITPEVPNA